MCDPFPRACACSDITKCPALIIYYYMTCMYRQNVHYNSSDSENHQVAALIRHHCEFAQLFHFTTTN